MSAADALADLREGARTDRAVRAEAVLDALDRHSRTLTPNLLVTYLAVIALDGIAGVDVERVARRTGFATSTTARQLVDLTGLGLVRRLSRSSYTTAPVA